MSVCCSLGEAFKSLSFGDSLGACTHTSWRGLVSRCFCSWPPCLQSLRPLQARPPQTPTSWSFPVLRLSVLLHRNVSIPPTAAFGAALFARSSEAFILGVAVFLGFVATTLAVLFITLWVWLSSAEHKRASLVALTPSRPLRVTHPWEMSIVCTSPLPYVERTENDASGWRLAVRKCLHDTGRRSMGNPPRKNKWALPLYLNSEEHCCYL